MSFVVGLTGGIGSGKTTVAQAFERLGAAVVDTDVLARALTTVGGKALPALCRVFGPDILASDGGLDRTVMRRRVFADPDSRNHLEAVLHPLIHQAALEAIAAAQASSSYCMLAIPLLVEKALGRYPLNRILVVDCQEEVQIQRVMARSQLSRAEVLQIMATQATRSVRLAVADDVIDNSGSIQDIMPLVEHLHAGYVELALQLPQGGR